MKKIYLLIEHFSKKIITLFLLISFICLNIQPVFASDGQWILTGSMNNPRQWHTATLLQNGQVLVAGGQDFSSSLASAELYNPSTGSWTITDSLNSGRYHHAAVLLTDGKVLVVGGRNDSSALASAELFNPEKGTWETTGSMNTARNFSTATLLQNGKVLVTGGNDGIGWVSANLSSAELYDPLTGTWANTGSMNSSRVAHTATLLQNGKVLVAGGVKNFGSYYKTLNSAELYDPDTGTWQSLASMNSERVLHTATLLPNGKLLVAGGRMDIFYFGQYYSISTISSTEIYDPATDIWETTNPMNYVRVHHTATLLPNGKVLVAGGLDYVDGQGFHSFTTNKVEIYDPATGLWQEISSLNNSRTGFSATLLQDGNLLLKGGYYENYPTHYSLSAAEYYYENYPPLAEAGGPYLVSTDSTIDIDGTGTDPDMDPLSYFWTATDGSFDDPSLEDPAYTAGSQAGINELTLTVTDPGGLSAEDTTLVVTYDPDAGFVTGSGWFDSPGGAYIPDPTLIGKATFGFVSKYKKGQSVPTGFTEFQFKMADLNFHSDTYQWLVVAGPKAMFKGTGTINGTGNYGFMITAIDEVLTPSTDVDLFRIKIWDKDNGDAIVYDNQFGDPEDADPSTMIGGGNIKIHKGD